MSLVIDAGPLIALADRRDPAGSGVRAALLEEAGELVVPAPVTAELLGTRLGRGACLAFLEDVAAGRLTVAPLDAGDHQAVLDLERRYADLDAGLADLSVVVVAHRYRTDRPLTFDDRHFRALRTLRGSTFTLLPADAARQ